MKDKLEKLALAYQAQVEAQKQCALDSAGTGKNIEAILLIGKTLDGVIRDLKAIIASEESNEQREISGS